MTVLRLPSSVDLREIGLRLLRQALFVVNRIGLNAEGKSQRFGEFLARRIPFRRVLGQDLGEYDVHAWRQTVLPRGERRRLSRKMGQQGGHAVIPGERRISAEQLERRTAKCILVSTAVNRLTLDLLRCAIVDSAQELAGPGKAEAAGADGSFAQAEVR